MSGIKFLITLFVIYLIFRSVMRKVLSSVNSEGGSTLKGKLGDVIEQVKREMEKARLEAEREAAGMDEEDFMTDDPWAELREPVADRRDEGFEERGGAPVSSRERWDADDERPILHERWNADDERPSLHERWGEGDERPALHERWNVEDDSAPQWERLEESHRGLRPSEAAPKSCQRRRRQRMRLREAIVWKEILDRPVGLK